MTWTDTIGMIDRVILDAVALEMATLGKAPWGEWGEVSVRCHCPPDRAAVEIVLAFMDSKHPDCACRSASVVAFTFEEIQWNQDTLEELIRAKALFAVMAACDEWNNHSIPEEAARRHNEQADGLARMLAEDS